MVRLREIPRAANFAWSPGSALPLIASGTRAGAVDADFSNDTQLEIWDLHLDSLKQSLELEPAASVASDSRFHDIAWGKASTDHPRGIIAGALENGSLDLWDAEALMTGTSKSSISRTSKHSGAIKSLQFNPFRSELLATAGAKGELFICDLNNVGDPFRLGNTTARADDFDALDWNKRVPHILVTGSSGGFATVWDVKAKKESLTLNNLGRRPVSAVAWDPQNSTKLMTATSDDANPVILLWDLRNSNAPEQILKGHEQGILSLSWCQQDSELLLSCGKDNRTICWNPATGQSLGEFPIVTNWTFQTSWNPHNPSLLATASFDGKIAVQTIQNTKPSANQTAGAHRQALDGEDFFNNAQAQPQSTTFTLPKPPKWLERPIGASFGFGGKVVSFGRGDDPQSRKSTVRISHYAIDSAVGTSTQVFEAALRERDLARICETKAAEAKSMEEKADWKVIETLLSDNPRKELLNHLGFSSSATEGGDADTEAPNDEADDEVESLPSAADQNRPTLANGTASAKANRLSSFFESAGEGDNFLSNLSAAKGAKTNNPFHIYTGSESTAEKQITKALMLGKFEKALEICLQEDKMSDAFMIAICGGQTCIDKVQAAYFARTGKGPQYLRLLAAVVGKNLWDVVYNADISNWKEAMATLCTFADANDFPDLCEALGDRLEEQLRQNNGSDDLRKDASFCYLAGSKLEKVVAIWIEELYENEAAGLQDAEAQSSFSIHARSLQNFIEKVTVFREVTKFQDTDKHRDSGWKLASLYDKYTEYADIVAAHGQLEVAEKYLDLLPAQYAAAEVARNRVKQASQRAVPAAAPRQPQPVTANQRKAQHGAMPFQPSTQAASNQGTQANTYGNIPSAPTTTINAYAPQTGGSYMPQGYQQPQLQQQQQQGQMPPPQSQYPGGYQPQQGLGLPPMRPPGASPAPPPPPKASNMSNWNDTPMVMKPSISRRGTPSTGPQTVSAPFTTQQSYGQQTPPPPSPYGAQPRATPPLPPPPKGPAPPPRTSSPSTGGVGQQAYGSIERPVSAATNPYAPVASTQSSGMAASAPPNPRGPSPYNPPPSGPPPSNRYAPAPASHDSGSRNPQDRSLPPPPSKDGRQDWASNRFGNEGSQSVAQGPAIPGSQALTSPPQPQGPPMTQGGPRGPLQGPPPGAGQMQQALPTASPATPPTATPPKHPAGDRSHIPSNARPIFEALGGDMQRVKSKAPASFRAQVIDTEKRLNILFDHLNNDDLLKPDTVESMAELSAALRSRDYETAQAIHLDVLTNKTNECGQWMVGVKRLIAMSRATP
ncbi:MAG: protein transport protein S31 [Caeruleum heppii]|nr:MAG: protein transport protein S31 [Caeruleum heppii]